MHESVPGHISGPSPGLAAVQRHLRTTDPDLAASRLEAMTKGTDHQLFIADATRRALTRPAPDLVALGELEIAGRDAPIAVWTLATRNEPVARSGAQRPAVAGAAAT